MIPQGIHHITSYLQLYHTYTQVFVTRAVNSETTKMEMGPHHQPLRLRHVRRHRIGSEVHVTAAILEYDNWNGRAALRDATIDSASTVGEEHRREQWRILAGVVLAMATTYTDWPTKI